MATVLRSDTRGVNQMCIYVYICKFYRYTDLHHESCCLNQRGSFANWCSWFSVEMFSPQACNKTTRWMQINSKKRHRDSVKNAQCDPNHISRYATKSVYLFLILIIIKILVQMWYLHVSLNQYLHRFVPLNPFAIVDSGCFFPILNRPCLCRFVRLLGVCSWLGTSIWSTFPVNNGLVRLSFTNHTIYHCG